ncbi:hypothetical protein [Desulfovibrio inopinatus]|uniref:hypothetical protein n=1 Tax=Desulfovibrio inopinatus TaxID=102109 RepID=UPI00047F7363|nr:hypothetical protein [Desulfovibrio inopinatus]
MKIILFIFLIMFTCSCAPKVAIHPLQHRVGQNVQYNTLAKTSVGDIIFSQYEYYSGQGASLLEGISQGAALGTVNIPPGDILFSSVIGRKEAYCTREKRYIDHLVGPYRIVCLFDETNNGRFDKLWVSPGIVPFTFSIKNPALYKKTEIVSGISSGFKYELIYQGIDKGTLRIFYREFIDNMARPAYQQDFTYTLEENEPTMITFRKTRIQVISADNNTVEYKVLSGFE